MAESCFGRFRRRACHVSCVTSPCCKKAASERPVNDSSVYPGWGMDGEALHSQQSGLPPNKWCITQEDLVFLRKELQDAIRIGRIKPTNRDPFDTSDGFMGPCMYNVVESYIKPLTYEAGKMSWALLRHPEGLSCHMFITHCWAEGAFEFIEKVLKSWPPRALKHAWCCIFANPQVLDIGHLIREPRTSPFAVALRCASHMMVVSTKNVSIYSRIWCAYEAHLATSENKIIFIATRPKHRILVKVALAGTTLFWVSNGLFKTHQWYSWVILFATHLIECFYYYQSRQSETLELGNAYASLLEAEASNPEDKENILGDIGQNMKEVEASVRMLMIAGVSSPYLREAAAKGAELWGSADGSFPWMSFYAWAYIELSGHQSGYIWIANLIVLVLTIIRYKMGQLRMGDAAFISSVVTKLTLVTAALYFLVFLHLNYATSSSMPVDILVLVMGCLALAFSLAGMSTISSIPVVGPKLASSLGPGWSWLLCACLDTSRMPRAAGFRKTASWIGEDLCRALARRVSKPTLPDQSVISAVIQPTSGEDVEVGGAADINGERAEIAEVQGRPREYVDTINP